MLISIIIPVYNTQDYLSKCLDSITNQLNADISKNIEIILVDDGSVDKSGEICDEYAKKYNFIKVVHQKNMGVSVARNNGLKLSSGDYIMFIDSDDFLHRDALSMFISKIKSDCQPDIIAGGFTKYYENAPLKEPKMFNRKSVELINNSKSNTYSLLIELSLFLPSVCGAIFRRSLFFDNDIFFEEGVINNEDVDCAMRLYLHAGKIQVIEKPHYYYRQLRSGSATNVFNSKRIYDSYNMIASWSKMLNELDLDNRLKMNLLDYIAYQYAIALGSVGLCEKREMKPLYDKMKTYRYLLKYGKSKKTMLVKYICKICGYSITGKLLSIFIKLKNK